VLGSATGLVVMGLVVMGVVVVRVRRVVVMGVVVRLVRDVAFRIGLELRQTMGAAEHVGAPFVLEAVGRVGPGRHAAHGIFGGGG
jgi:hypothetical protein